MTRTPLPIPLLMTRWCYKRYIHFWKENALILLSKCIHEYMNPNKVHNCWICIFITIVFEIKNYTSDEKQDIMTCECDICTCVIVDASSRATMLWHVPMGRASSVWPQRNIYDVGDVNQESDSCFAAILPMQFIVLHVTPHIYFE